MTCAGNRMERTGQYCWAGVAAVAIMLLWSGVCMAQMQNPSFEATYSEHAGTAAGAVAVVSNGPEPHSE